MSIHNNENVNTVNTNVNTSILTKNKQLQIRVSQETKDKIQKIADEKRISLSKLVLDSVLNNGKTNGIDTKTLKTLVNGIFEFNKIMKFNKGHIRFPKDLDKNKLIEAIKLCQMKI